MTDPPAGGPGADLPHDGEGNPVREFWGTLLSEMEATASAYEDDGWETLALHPGDTTPLPGEGDEPPAFDVLLPDNEFAALRDLVEAGADFDAYEVYATSEGGAVFDVVVMQDATTETAVLFPLYAWPEQEETVALRERAAEVGRLETRLRRLAADEIVRFSHDDPSLFFPGE